MENNLNMNTNTSLNNDNTQTKAPVLKPILSIRNLTKKYKERYAVNNISLDIYSGQIVGFLGANGAGKSTTIKMLTGLASITSGDAYIYGHSVKTDFEKAITASVNHSGDSDSTGAVTGNILGAYLGLSAIPQKFLDKLELRDVIMEIADDLYNDCCISENEPYIDEVWENKYINYTYMK